MTNASDEATTSVAVGVAFACASALLATTTLGMAYVAFREFIDREDERKAKEADERAERFVESNKAAYVKSQRKARTEQKMTPSMIAARERGDGGNRRERRDARRRDDDVEEMN